MELHLFQAVIQPTHTCEMVTVTGLYANDTYVSLYATSSYQTFTDRLFPFDSATRVRARRSVLPTAPPATKAWATTTQHAPSGTCAFAADIWAMMTSADALIVSSSSTSRTAYSEKGGAKKRSRHVRHVVQAEFRPRRRIPRTSTRNAVEKTDIASIRSPESWLPEIITTAASVSSATRFRKRY